MRDTIVLIMGGRASHHNISKDLGSRLDVIRYLCIMEFSHIDNFILKAQIYTIVIFEFSMLVVYHGYPT